MKIAAVVPSRLNSERVPSKNIKELCGIPLINYALRTLSKVEIIDEVIVFASEPSISSYIEKDLKYTFLERPSWLDSQSASIQDIISEFLKLYDVDLLLLLHITSPFIQPNTISDCVVNVISGEFDSAFTAYSFRKFAWYKGAALNYSLDLPIPRTQDIAPVLIEQSSLYVFSRETFNSDRRRIGNRPYIKIVDPIEGHDIDTPEDFEIAEMIVKANLFG